VSDRPTTGATSHTESETIEASRQAQEAAQALAHLAETRPDLAASMARLITAVATEARRTNRFANALQAALAPTGLNGPTGGLTASKRTGRRARGVLDPFAEYTASGEEGLRDRLGELGLEQLRDIVAEHGMDHDRLAMKWKDSSRVIDRIVAKVTARASKGSAFRSADD
jgi:hypothetical protein